MANQKDSQPSKRELLESLLQEGMVLLHLDASAEGVDVPPGLRSECELGLNLSYRFQGRLAVHEEGVDATLSFAGEPYACSLPFDAVYAMVSHDTGEGFFFPTEAPPAALAALAAALESGEQPIAEVTEAAHQADTPRRPTFSVIEGGPPLGEPEAAPDEQQETSEAPEEQKPDGRPRLRLVK